MKKINSVEAWIDTASLLSSQEVGEVFLKVVQELEDGSLEIIHPNDSQIVQSFENYQDVYDWLR